MITNKLAVLELVVGRPLLAVLSGLDSLGMGSEEGSGTKRNLIRESLLLASHPDSVTNLLDSPVSNGQKGEAVHGPPGQAVTQISTKPHHSRGGKRRSSLLGGVQSWYTLCRTSSSKDRTSFNSASESPCLWKDGRAWGHTCVSCTWRRQKLSEGQM